MGLHNDYIHQNFCSRYSSFLNIHTDGQINFFQTNKYPLYVYFSTRNNTIKYPSIVPGHPYKSNTLVDHYQNYYSLHLNLLKAPAISGDNSNTVTFGKQCSTLTEGVFVFTDNAV